MGMFSKSEPTRKTTDSRSRSSAPRPGSGESALSIIGPGMRVRGDISTDGTVRIEGTVEGSIQAAKSVVLGKEGRIIGDVVTQDAILGGYLQGSVLAEARLELQSTCVVDGEVRTRAEHLKLEEGAQFNGVIQMTDGQDKLPQEPRKALPPRSQEAVESAESH